MPNIKAFIAYASSPHEVGRAIEGSKSSPQIRHSFSEVETWKELDIAGNFIANEVLSKIDEKDVFFADISALNFNVTYELGYAIGRKKKVRIILNQTISKVFREDLTRVGIFDTLGYQQYQNTEDLAQIFQQSDSAKAHNIDREINKSAPLYFVDSEMQDDLIIAIKSRIKKSGIFFKSFDPNETSRMSAYDEIRNVAESLGVIVTFLPDVYTNARIHNLRAAFVAGLAQGMNKETLFLQLGEGPVPLDYRDLVCTVQSPRDIIDAIAEFAPKLVEAFQSTDAHTIERTGSLLERVNLGASAAENEFRELGTYYVEIDAFKRAVNGEVRIVLGRKGAGKTALFSQVRDKKRQNRKNIVIDLKPETYKLLKFKDEVLSLLEEGTLEHTIMAFWEYLLYIELCYKVLEKDKKPHLNNHELFEPYKKLYDLYHSDEYVSEGDFSERASTLLQDITNDFNSYFSRNEATRLTRAQITELLYRHQIRELRDNLVEYLRFKDEVVILIDNLDKGWNTLGVNKEDLMILRTLLEASRKIENHLSNHDVPCHTLIFLRNDVYELLLSAMTDRGKEPKMLLDWTDPRALKELIRRRLASTEGVSSTITLEEVWRKIAESHVKGEESFNYLLDRSLMRPRILIDLIKSCRAIAVNRGDAKITADDFSTGAATYSHNLIEEINLEIRDAYPSAHDILYNFIEQSETLSKDDIFQLFLESGVEQPEDWDALLRILLWYGVIGIVKSDGEHLYIYDVSYDMKILLARIKKEDSSSKTALFCINPAFWGALEIAH